MLTRASAAKHVFVCLVCGGLLIPAGAWAQAVTAAPEGFASGFARAPGLFPGVWRPYIEETVETPSLDNSERLGKLIHGGELRLSLYIFKGLHIAYRLQ